MLLGIFSDTHLGFGSDERYNEAFERFKESLELFKQKKVDFILHAGDLFDHSIPTQEVWDATFDCFSYNLNNFTKIEKVKNDSSQFVYVKGIPIIAIHGTHEHRGRDFVNALDILEKSNSLVHVHAGYAKLEKELNGEKEVVFIHGMGGIPEKMAKQALEKYSPSPINNSTNLLLLHQSFKEFLPFDDESIATLSLADLPIGFDLIINGHLHWINEQEVSGKRFLLCGSTIYTQMKKLESEKGKGIFLFDTISKKIEFVPFEKQRKLFYEKMKFENALPSDIIKKAEDKISEILSNKFEIKPLIRLKLVGTIAKGFSQKDVQIKTSDDAIFSITKNFSVEEFKKRINDLKEIQKQKKSVIEFGIELLENKVLEANLSDFDTRRIFELLSQDQIEKVEKLLLNKNN